MWFVVILKLAEYEKLKFLLICVYTTAVFGTARLNLGTRTYKFWHGMLNFSRVNGRKTGPRAVYTTKIKRAVPKFVGSRA